ncbi:MAG: tripartite tricarboxylate transporter TctB family protein [Burkholderiales bacterium]|nr:tripartite tricarboxylate transporter TctB family protein [Burkholderiales bacterium]
MPERALGADRIAGAALAVFGIYVAWAALEYPFGSLAEPGPALLPFTLAMALAVFGAVMAMSRHPPQRAQHLSFAELPHALVILGVLAAAAVGMERIGYRALVLAMLFFLLAVIERRDVRAAGATAAVMAFGTFYLINDVLRVPLPVGPWGW